MSKKSSRFLEMQALHKARHVRERELSENGVDYIAESRASAIGRLVDRSIKNNRFAIPRLNELDLNARDSESDDQCD